MRPSTLHACLCCLALATSSFGCAAEADPELGTETSAVSTPDASETPSLRSRMGQAGADLLAQELTDELQTNLLDDSLTVGIGFYSVVSPDVGGETYSMKVLISFLRDHQIVAECYGRLVENKGSEGKAPRA